MNSICKFFFVLFIGLFISCEDDVLPKPNGFLRLQYQDPIYAPFISDCPYTFQKNTIAKIKQQRGCWIDLEYPNMKGTIHLSYRKVEDNLKSLLTDAQKLTLEHTAKADGIEGSLFENKELNVYGMFYQVEGNAASQAQFYATDSTNHFLTGSLYFYAKPNYDSIYPAAVYLKKDIRRLMESLEWRE